MNGPYKQNVADYMLLRLETTSGTSITGVVNTDVLLAVKLAKNGGSAVSKGLNGTNWTEVSDGYYWLQLSAADTGTVGVATIIVIYNGVAFAFPFRVFAALTDDVNSRIGAPAGASLSADVVAVKADTAAIKLKTDLLPATPAAAGDAMALTPAERLVVADAIWDEARAGHATAGTFGQGVASVQGAVTGAVATVTALAANSVNASALATDAVTEINAAVVAGTVGVNVAAIKAKTDNLPASPASQTNLDVAVSSRLATAGYTAPDNTTIGTINTRLGAPAGASHAADVAAVKVDTEAIKLKTDNLPANPASQTNLDVAVSSRLDAASYLAPDNIGIQDIQAKTDNLPVNPASQTNLDVAVSTRLATAGYTAPDNTTVGTINTRLGAPVGASHAADVAAVKSDTAAVKAKTDNLPASPADEATLATMASTLERVLGLLGDNQVEDNLVFDGDDLLSARIRSYDTAANANAAGVTGLRDTWTVVATYSAPGVLETYTVTR